MPLPSDDLISITGQILEILLLTSLRWKVSTLERQRAVAYDTGRTGSARSAGNSTSKALRKKAVWA